LVCPDLKKTPNIPNIKTGKLEGMSGIISGELEGSFQVSGVWRNVGKLILYSITC
jgi:hypothetical protein